MPLNSPAESVQDPGPEPRLAAMPESPDDLGHEGMQSTIKPNTTGAGERQDRD